MSTQNSSIRASYNTTVRARIDNKVKMMAEKVLEDIGMDPSDAIRLFYKQIANRGEFPLELKIPNQITIDAINADCDPEIYDSAASLLASI